MAWAFRTGSYANNGAGALVAQNGTTTVTLGAAVSAGDLLVLHVIELDTNSATVPTVTAISDSVNGSWSTTADATLTQSVASLGERQSVFSFPNSGAGTPVITVTVGNSAGNNINVGLQCAAFSGIATAAPLDVVATNTGTSSTPSAGPTSATGGANRLALGFYGDYGEGDTITEGTGYTLAGKHQSDTGKYEALMEYKDSGASGSTISAGVTLSATNTGWGMLVAVYKISGGATGANKDTPTRFKLRAQSFKDTLTRLRLRAQAFKDTVSRFKLTATLNGFYTTNFSATESPMSEGNLWSQGLADGLDWTNVNTGNGIAYGTENGTNTNTGIGVTPSEFDDSTAILVGTWAADQQAQATIQGVGHYGTSSTEVELRLRSAISAHSITGIEVELSLNLDNYYFDLVRWNGQVADFTQITHLDSTALTAAIGTISNGGVLKATVVGNTVSAYYNGTLITTSTDSRWGTLTGKPGVGFFYTKRDTTVDTSTYGFTDFTARNYWSYKDTPTRFRLLAQAYKHTVARFKLLAQAFRDTPSLFRLLAQAFKETAARFRLAARAFRDSATRYRLRAQAFKDTATRFVVNVVGATTRDTAALFKLVSVATFRDTPLRTRIQSALQNRDTPTRFRQLAQGFHETLTRFVLQVAGQAFKDTVARFRLSSVAQVHDTAMRFAVIVLGYRHSALRFNLVGSLHRNSGLRFRLTTGGTQGARSLTVLGRTFTLHARSS